MPQVQTNHQNQSPSSLVAVRSQIAEAMIWYLRQVTELLETEDWKPHPLSSPPISQDVVPECNSKDGIYWTLLEEFKAKKIPIEKLTIPLYFDLEKNDIVVPALEEQRARNMGRNIANNEPVSSNNETAIDYIVSTAFKAIIFDPSSAEKQRLESWLKRNLTEEKTKNIEIYLKGSEQERKAFENVLKKTSHAPLLQNSFIATKSAERLPKSTIHNHLLPKESLATKSNLSSNKIWKVGIPALIALVFFIYVCFRIISPPSSSQIKIILLDADDKKIASHIKDKVKRYLGNSYISNDVKYRKGLTETEPEILARDNNVDMVMKVQLETLPNKTYHGTISIYRQKINIKGYTGLNQSTNSQLDLPSDVSLKIEDIDDEALDRLEDQLAILAITIAIQDKGGFGEESDQKYFRDAQERFRVYDKRFDTPVNKRNAIGVFWTFNYGYTLAAVGSIDKKDKTIEEALQQYIKIDKISVSDDFTVQRLRKLSYANRAQLSYFLSTRSSDEAAIKNYLEQADKNVDQYFGLEISIGDKDKDKENAQMYLLGVAISSKLVKRTKAKAFFKKAAESYQKARSTSNDNDISDYIFLASQADAIAIYNEFFYTEDDSEKRIIPENKELGFEEMIVAYQDINRRNPDPSLDIEKIKSEFLNKIGTAYFWRCDYDSAINYYTQAIQSAERCQHDKLRTFYYDRGQAYHDAAFFGKMNAKTGYTNAIPDLRKALDSTPEAPFYLALSIDGNGGDKREIAEILNRVDENNYWTLTIDFDKDLKKKMDNLWESSGKSKAAPTP